MKDIFFLKENNFIVASYSHQTHAVPGNIHTSPTQGNGNSKGEGVGKRKTLGKVGEGANPKNSSMVGYGCFLESHIT